MSIQSNVRDMLSDEGGKISSKRVITFIAFIAVIVAFVGNLIFNKIMEENILTGMIEIVWAGLGVTVGEHLLKKRTSNNDDEYGDDEPIRYRKSPRRNRNQDEPSYRNTDIVNPDEDN